MPLDYRMLQQFNNQSMHGGMADSFFDNYNKGQADRARRSELQELAGRKKKRDQDERRSEMFESNLSGLLSNYGEYAQTPEGQSSIIRELAGAGFPKEAMSLNLKALVRGESLPRKYIAEEYSDPETGKPVLWERPEGAPLSSGKRVEGLGPKKAAPKGDGTPSTVSEWNYYNNLSPGDQARFLEMKRAQKTLDLGGAHGVVGLGGEITKTVPKSLSPGELPSTKRAQAAATAEGTESVTGAAAIAKAKAERERDEAARKHQTYKMAKAGEVASINDFVSLVENVSANKNLYGAVGAGKGLSRIWGSDYADVHADLKRIVGSGAIETMAKLKRESPTGSTGFGALSEKELGIIQSAFSVLADENISVKKAREELERIATSMRTYLKRVEDFEKSEESAGADPAKGAAPTYRDYDNLESGAEFTDPEGNVRRKP